MSEEPRPKVLVVDDEPQITRVLKTALYTQGYDVRIAGNGSDGVALFHEWRPDIVITDLSMPDMSGVELCREIRTLSETPIIVLSVRNQEKAKIDALDAGADDYVTKPFSIQELQARLRAQLRRAAYSALPQPEVLTVGDFVIDSAQHRVTVSGESVHLTPKQFELLRYFAHHAEQVLTHRTLLNAVWGGNAVEQPEYLRVAIGQLRKKIEPASEPRYIVTEPWIGYRFCPRPEET
jgi:two-component system KDP operon response regulator KdpE